MEQSTTEIQIGGRESDCLIIRINARAYPESFDAADGNWLNAEVVTSIGPFQATVRALLRSEEIVRFRDSLKHLYETLDGKIKFSTMEAWLEILVKATRSGAISAEIKLSDPNNYSNCLSFSLNFDQTYIPRIIRELDSTIEQYPVRGLQT